ncbi:thioredoxin family protein [Galbibacter mesophilus]|uniref:thioredoxin family protein n=1 Tax=Galbibacter mesophilus TaxID=379069 RepID=UPI00191FFA2C|nr:thioredoxin family protein [Galbibacter mesophilus]MCM5662476.1 thioredoxin family protein [Galbibacter mesophilus]
MEEITVENVIQKSLKEGKSYDDYIQLHERLVVEGKNTGDEQTEALVNYTKLNAKRMQRLTKTISLPEETLAKLQDLDHKVTWLVITESWCGDAAQSLPIIQKFAAASENIDLKIVLRDEHKDLMDQFLTNGSKSIPKLIMLDDASGEVLNTWGPRPSKATKMVKEEKEKFGILSAEFKQELQVWYNKDKGKNVIEDLKALLSLE